jgi:signal peptidase I
MEAALAGRRPKKRLLLLLIPTLAAGLWYGSHAVGYVANLRAFMVPSGSMAPAIQWGDRITVDTRGGTPNRGEIWAFHGPNSSTLIKRVIGLPGETIEVADGRVLIDGKALDEPYLASPMTYTMPPISLGPEQYFMLGDSRNTSADSHVWGPLHKSKFIGRAETRFWPKDRIGPVR